MCNSRLLWYHRPISAAPPPPPPPTHPCIGMQTINVCTWETPENYRKYRAEWKINMFNHISVKPWSVVLNCIFFVGFSHGAILFGRIDFSINGRVILFCLITSYCFYSLMKKTFSFSSLIGFATHCPVYFVNGSLDLFFPDWVFAWPNVLELTSNMASWKPITIFRVWQVATFCVFIIAWEFTLICHMINNTTLLFAQKIYVFVTWCWAPPRPMPNCSSILFSFSIIYLQQDACLSSIVSH